MSLFSGVRRMTAALAGLGFVLGQLLFCLVLSMSDPKPFDPTVRNEEATRQGALFIDQWVSGELQPVEGIDIADYLERRFSCDATFFGVAACERLRQYRELRDVR